jgi:membrane protease YdiL (CAAX protease family)
MIPMAKSLGRFRAALLIGWIILGAAGLLYAHFKSIPSWAAIPVLIAFLLEFPFYLVPAFAELRKRLAGRSLPLFLVISLILPFLVCSIAAGHVAFLSVVKLAALALAVGLWYVVLPTTILTDLGFLALVASALLGGYFDRIYPVPYPGLQTSILGRAGLFHMTVLVLVLERHIRETGYGFLPNSREWRIGAMHYAGFLPIAAVVAIPLKAVHLTSPAPAWKTVGVFLGFLWVIALFEEFIFRGVLQQWIEEWNGNRTSALLFTSLIFGSAHLWFRGFPNWRWALIAGVLGWFCGHARNQAGSIRAGVVTHALVVATWRGFFT